MATRIYYGPIPDEFRDLFDDFVADTPQYADWSKDERQQEAEYFYDNLVTAAEGYRGVERYWEDLGYEGADLDYVIEKWRDLYGR
jgi:hypothetical protein